MYENRIKHLKEAHHVLDKRIDAKESTEVYSDDDLTHMKRERLKLKDEITRLEKLQAEHLDSNK